MYHGKPYDANDKSNIEVQSVGASEVTLSELLKTL